MNNSSSQPRGRRAPTQQARTNKRRRNRNRKRTRSAVNKGINISPCVIDFAIAQNDPWATEDLPCIPDLITLPSSKFMTRARGTFAVGSSGVAFVNISPGQGYHSDVNYTTTRTDGAVAYSTSAFAGANMGWSISSSVPTTGVTVTGTSSPFVKTGISTTQNKIRVVACGLRIRYVSDQASMGGRCLMYRHRTNNTVPGGGDGNNSNIASLLNDLMYSASPVDRQWKSVVYRHTDAVQLTYNAPYDATAAGMDSYPMLALIEGGTQGKLFEYDAIWFFEHIGTQAFSVTKSPSDPVGFAAVQSAGTVVETDSAPSRVSQVLSHIGRELASASHSAIAGFASMAGNAASTGAGVAAYQIYRSRIRANRNNLLSV